MKRFLIALAIVSLATTAENGFFGVPEDEHVAVLGKGNFDEFIKNNKYVFVKFYAPWCGHCKSMAPGYSKLAKRMQAEKVPIAIAKVDATIETELSSKFGVQGFPTLKFFINGEAVDYQGQREEEDIYNWIIKKTGPSSSRLNTLEELTAHADKKFSVIFLADEGEKDSLNKFMITASSFENVPFAHSHSEEFKKKYEISQKLALIIFRKFDDGMKFLVNDEDLSVEAMKNFISQHKFPIVMEFEQEAAERIFGNEATAMFYFNDDIHHANSSAFREFAGENKSDMIYSVSTITTGLGARLAEFIGITPADVDTVRIIKFEAGNVLKYKLTDVTKDNLSNFVQDFMSGRLHAYFKSEAVPASNDEPVKVIVGETFEDLVLNNDKHVFLEAYAPWCGHCKKLAPIYDELAKLLKGFPNVVIAKIDATANEHHSLNVKGFPTIKLYKKGSKQNPIDFTGDRTLEGMKSFLEKELEMKFDTGTETSDL